MKTKHALALAIAGALLATGCPSTSAPTAIQRDADPANMNPATQQVLAAEQEIMKLGAANVPEATLRQAAGIAGNKDKLRQQQQNQQP